jgi:hypothetical protein
MDASRNTLIKDGTDEEWHDFEEHIEMLEPDDLAAIADRLQCSQQTDWHDYVKVFSDYEWAQFLEAYEHVMARTY